MGTDNRQPCVPERNSSFRDITDASLNGGLMDNAFAFLWLPAWRPCRWWHRGELLVHCNEWCVLVVMLHTESPWCSGLGSHLPGRFLAAPSLRNILVNTPKEDFKSLQAVAVVRKVFLLPHDTYISTPNGEFPRSCFSSVEFFTDLYNTMFPALIKLTVAGLVVSREGNVSNEALHVIGLYGPDDKIFFSLEGLGAGKGGIELPHGPGHVVPGYS